MCAYLNFLKFSNDKVRDSSYVELRKSLEKDHRSFELGLKTLSYVLSVKSNEIPYGRVEPNDIWSYFNGTLSQECVEFLNELDKENVESLLVGITHLLTDNVVVGLGPVISKLGYSALGKEFYSRTVALLVNLTRSAYRRFGSSVGDEDVYFPPPDEMNSCEKVEEWRMNLLNKNLTFALCRLTVVVSIFGTEEVGLFESYSDIPVGLLDLFDSELWAYLLGTFPTVCFDNKFLFSINSRSSYIEGLSDQYLDLVRSLMRYDYYCYVRSKVFDNNSETLYVLMMCGWIDHMSNYVRHNLVLNNQKGRENKARLNASLNWLSNQLSNRVVMDMIYTVFRFNYKLCFETLLRLSQFNDNLMFIENIIFKSDLKDDVIFELLSRLGLEVISKDVMSLRSILNYMLDGIKGSRKSEFLRLWKMYLAQYPLVMLNLSEINKYLDKVLKYLFENGYNVLQYSEDHFNPEVHVEKETNKTNRDKKDDEQTNVDQVLLHRNLLIKLVEIFGYDIVTSNRENLILRLEEGYQLIKKHEHTYRDLTKIEFSLFLIYFFGLKEEYPDYDKLKNNNINLQYNLYLISLDSKENKENNMDKKEERGKEKQSNKEKKEKEQEKKNDKKDYEEEKEKQQYNKVMSKGVGRTSNIDEDYVIFVSFYNMRRILKNHGKGYFGHLNKLTNWYKGIGELNGLSGHVDGFSYPKNFYKNYSNNTSGSSITNNNSNSEDKDSCKNSINSNNKTSNSNSVYKEEYIGKYMFKLLFDKYRRNILHNIVNRFPELNQESFSTAKFYLNNAVVYFRMYDQLMLDIENKKRDSCTNFKYRSLKDEEQGYFDENVSRKSEELEYDQFEEENDEEEYQKLKEKDQEENNKGDNEKDVGKEKGKNKGNKQNKEKQSNKEKKEKENDSIDFRDTYENKSVDKYIQSFEKVVIDSLAILFKYDQLAGEYEELLKYILYLAPYHYLKILDSNYNLARSVVVLIVESLNEDKQYQEVRESREYKEEKQNEYDGYSNEKEKENKEVKEYEYNEKGKQNKNRDKKDDEQFMRKVVLFVIRLTSKIISESDWSWNHLRLFEKLVLLFTKMLGNTNYINSLMTHKQGASLFKNLLVVANSISIQETSFKVAVNMLNLAVIDRVLGLNSAESQGRRPTASTDNSLRSHDFASRELESILTSSCAKFKISGSSEEDKLALGTLSVLDLLIYQSFSQVFGAYQGLEKRETLKEHFKIFNLESFSFNTNFKFKSSDFNSDGNLNFNQNLKLNNNLNNYRNQNQNKDWNLFRSDTESRLSNFDGENWKQGVNRSGSSKCQEYVQNILSNHLFYWNFLGPQYMLSLQFIGKIFLGFSFLPQTKLVLISDYFFLYASTKTNIKTKKVRERFLTDNNLVRSETPSFMYDIYRMIYCNSFV